MSFGNASQWLLWPLLALVPALAPAQDRPAAPPASPPTATVPAPTPTPIPPAVPLPTPDAEMPDAGALPAGAWDGAWPWQQNSSLAQLGRRQDILLSGVRNTDGFEFQVRRDRLVRDLELELAFTPSPALIPTLSHLRVYLNDALMGVVPVSREQLGRPSQARLPLDARLVADFNRVRFEFIGHYTDICEEPVHSSLWMNIASTTTLRLGGQSLAMSDDLAHFPLPFFDSRDPSRLELPVVFAGVPSLGQQRAAALMASYFGSLAGWWRQARFPVSFDQVPGSGHAVVMGVNGSFPAVIAGHPPVDGPVIGLMSMPGDPLRKLLLVLGRNDEDLQLAVAAMAAGNVMFRGTSVRVDKMEELAPRKPYDAPNWVRTDRPVRFAELIDYPNQLNTSGISPHPVTLNMNLPPDLFIWRSRGVPMDLRYRYTPPIIRGESRLAVSINDRFVASFPLLERDSRREVREMHLPVLGTDAGIGRDDLSIPALRLGDHNQLRFDFNFASVVGSAQRDQCQTTLPPNSQASINEDSVIDFSRFHHYMAMPDLAAFSLSGFPFTRMADLSETVVLVPPKATPAQVGLLLNLVGGMGVQSGYPAYGLRLAEDWGDASKLDADLLVLGPMPDELRENPDLSLMLDRQHSTLLNGRTPDPAAVAAASRFSRQAAGDTVNRVGVTANAPFAAILGLQSPHHPQRSIVSLLASTDADLALLNEALTDIGKREAIAGSVSILRTSGIHSQFVGKQYHIGTLPWTTLVWYWLSDHPALLALLALLGVLMFAFLLWQALRAVARRRLSPEV